LANDFCRVSPYSSSRTIRGRYARPFKWDQYLAETNATAAPVLLLRAPANAIVKTEITPSAARKTDKPFVVQQLAFEVFERHFKSAKGSRDVVVELAKLGEQLLAAAQPADVHSFGPVGSSSPARSGHPSKAAQESEVSTTPAAYRTRVTLLLTHLRDLLLDQNLSSFEFRSTGLAEALLYFLTGVGADGVDGGAPPIAGVKHVDRAARIDVFREVFLSSPGVPPADADSSAEIADVDRSALPGQVLLNKLVEVLETVENLPLILHDQPGSGLGLQILTRQLRFRLKCIDDEGELLDLSGRTFRMEPLASVRTLEKYVTVPTFSMLN
jgi:hypothetical protein